MITMGIKKHEHFDLTLTWSNRKKNSQETQIYTLFFAEKLCTNSNKIKLCKNSNKINTGENRPIFGKGKSKRGFSDSHIKGALLNHANACNFCQFREDVEKLLLVSKM